MGIKRFVLLVFFFMFIFSRTVCAQDQDEEITLTTYYPAPYGEYEDLTTGSLTIGSGDTSYALPTARGETGQALVLNAGATAMEWSSAVGSNIKTGTYVGNGVSNRAFTGIGFQPTAIMLFGDGGSSYDLLLQIQDSDLCEVKSGMPSLGVSVTFTTDGFTLSGTTGNNNGVNYYYIVIKG